MKKIFLFLFFSIALSICFAQENMQNIKSNAHYWIENAFNQIKNQASTHIIFEYQLQNNPPYIGHLYLSKQKYHLSIKDMIQICDGENTYTLSEEEKEITITINELSEEISPLKKLEMYKNNYLPKLSFLKKLKDKNKTLQVIELYPKKEESKRKEHFLIEIDTATFELYQIIEREKHQDFLRIRIHKWDKNIPIDKDLFTFKKEDRERYEKLGFIITELN